MVGKELASSVCSCLTSTLGVAGSVLTGTLGGGLTSSVGGGAATSGWASDSGVVSRAVSGIAAAVAAADGCGVSVAALVAGVLGDDTCSACARVCSACVGPGETNCMASF